MTPDTPAQVLLGLVGYCAFVRSYPLGPELLERVQAAHWPQDMLVREMNWGPIAIVQDFQANRPNLRRVVLVAATDRGHPPHTVHCHRWCGGTLDPLVMQERVFEAVTGVISVDNLLVIGEHFGIWPPEVLTVEVQLADANIGVFVMAELASGRSATDAAAIGKQPLAPALQPVVERIAQRVRHAVLHGADGLPDLSPLHATDLTPVMAFCHNQDIGDGPRGIRHGGST